MYVSFQSKFIKYWWIWYHGRFDYALTSWLVDLIMLWRLWLVDLIMLWHHDWRIWLCFDIMIGGFDYALTIMIGGFDYLIILWHHHFKILAKIIFLFIKYFYIFFLLHLTPFSWLIDHSENKAIRLFCVILSILFFFSLILLLTSTFFLLLIFYSYVI